MFKLLVLVETFSDKTTTRIVRDVLTLSRVCSSQKVDFIVAIDDNLKTKIGAMGVKTSSNFTSASLVRAYSATPGFSDSLKDRIPDGVECEFIVIDETPKTYELRLDEDPYSGIDLFDSTVPIQETMPLDMKAPDSSSQEPAWNPYL